MTTVNGNHIRKVDDDLEREAIRTEAKNERKWKTLPERARAMNGAGQRLTTGIKSLDDGTRGGFPGGKYIAFVGAPGAAKTTFAVHLGDKWNREGIAVAILACDEPADGLLVRIGQLDGLAREDLESDSPFGREELASRTEGRLGLFLFDSDEDDMTIEAAHAELVKVAPKGPRVLIVDSLQTAHTMTSRAAETYRQRLDDVVGVCKRLARSGTIVIGISEMSRAGYRMADPTQNVSALAAGKESGSIEYGCSLLLGMRSVKDEPTMIDVEVAKNRLGPFKGTFRLQLNFRRASLTETTKPDDAAAKVATEEDRTGKARERVLRALRKHTSLRTKNDVSRRAGGNRQDNLAAVTDLIEMATIGKVDGCFRVVAPNENGAAQ